jgi:hypothetical protein
MRDQDFVNSHIQDELGELIKFGLDMSVSSHKMKEFNKDKSKLANFNKGIKDFNTELYRIQRTILTNFATLMESF